MLKTFNGLDVVNVAKVSGVDGAAVPGEPPAAALDGLPDAILDQQRQSWLDGKPLTVEEILAGTEYQDDREALLDLLYNEIVVQEEIGIQPSFDDYIRRYPHLEQDLRLHFEVHQAVNQQSLLDTSTPENEPSWPVSESRTERIDLPLDRYKIDRIIGEGGMAVVYQAAPRCRSEGLSIGAEIDRTRDLSNPHRSRSNGSAVPSEYRPDFRDRRLRRSPVSRLGTG